MSWISCLAPAVRQRSLRSYPETRDRCIFSTLVPTYSLVNRNVGRAVDPAGCGEPTMPGMSLLPGTGLHVVQEIESIVRCELILRVFEQLAGIYIER
jgi:hypothetical protein